MINTFLYVYWTMFPSLGIRVYLRMVEFVCSRNSSIAVPILQTVFDKCSDREQIFLKNKGLDPR